MQEKAKIWAKLGVNSAKKRSFCKQERFFTHLEGKKNSSGGRGAERACGGGVYKPGCARTMRRHNAIIETAHSRAARLKL
jgi:hypothetical protein